MADVMTKTRGTTIFIGTTAATAATDTYVEIEKCKILGGNLGKTWSAIDVTTLKDVYKQETKGVADGGKLEIGGILLSDSVDGSFAPGIQALSDANDDESDPDVYNIKIVRPNNAIAYLKCRVMGFTTTMGTNSNVHEYKATLTNTADIVFAAAA